MRWFGWFRKKEFPLPKEAHMSLDELFRYWGRMPAKYRAECEWYLYRMDPAKAPFLSVLKFRATEAQVAQDQKAFARVPPTADTVRFLSVDRLSPDSAWWDEQEATDPGRERRCFFLVRIIRRWKVSGADRHAEVAVAPFDLIPEAMPQLASSRTGKMI